MFAIIDQSARAISSPDDLLLGEELWAGAEPPVFATVPASVTRYQARAWIFAHGATQALWTTVAEMDAFIIGAIHAQPGLSAIEKGIAEIRWISAATLERDDPLVAALAPIIGLTTQEQIDQALREAALIT